MAKYSVCWRRFGDSGESRSEEKEIDTGLCLSCRTTGDGGYFLLFLQQTGGAQKHLLRKRKERFMLWDLDFLLNQMGALKTVKQK